MNPIVPPPAARPTTDSLHTQVIDMINQAVVWIQTHWLQIALAGGAGFAIYLGLNFLRAWGADVPARAWHGNLVQHYRSRYS